MKELLKKRKKLIIGLALVVITLIAVLIWMKSDKNPDENNSKQDEVINQKDEVINQKDGDDDDDDDGKVKKNDESDEAGKINTDFDGGSGEGIIIDKMGNEGKLENQANGPLYYDNINYTSGVITKDSKVSSDLRLNEDMVGIAKKLGFELKPIGFYLRLESADLTDVETAYNYLRGINLYLAANDVNYSDKEDLREIFQELSPKYLRLKYGDNTTKDYDETKFGFKGAKEKEENKMESYSYLIGGEVMPTRFFYPSELIHNEKIMFENQNGYESAVENGLETVWKFLENKGTQYSRTLDEAGKQDLEKINSVVAAYNDAYINQNYEAFAKLVHKDNRESFALVNMARMKDKTFVSSMTFVPNYINSLQGIAMGYSLNISAEPMGITVQNDGMVDREEAIITIEKVFFIENAKGEWEIYFQQDTGLIY